MTLTLADVVKEINIMIEASAEPSKPTVDAIFSLCLKSGWGYREDNVPHKSVAWHDSNRFGAGIDAIDLHGLLDNIIDQSKGWSWPSCGVGRAFEKAPTGTERHAAQVAKINECIEAADGYLPNLKEYDVRILSVANTHTPKVYALPSTTRQKATKRSIAQAAASIKRKCFDWCLLFGSRLR